MKSLENLVEIIKNRIETDPELKAAGLAVTADLAKMDSIQKIRLMSSAKKILFSLGVIL